MTTCNQCQSCESTLKEIRLRSSRIESRLVQLMLAMGLDPEGRYDHRNSQHKPVTYMQRIKERFL